ncbi:MAG: hypothetical protein AAGI13_05320 [Pseudomonadota bacterium]
MAINVALYGPGVGRWSMTERGRPSLWRDATHFAVGASHMCWEGDVLTLQINERAVPHLGRIQGRIRLWPEQLTADIHDLAPAHHWHPHAPTARIELDFQRPDLRWEGHGYLDQNWGEEPIENGFRRWDWLRVEGDGTGDPGAVLYAGMRRDGSPFGLALGFPGDGRTEPMEVPPTQPLDRGLWRVARSIPAEPGATPRVLKRFEDSPFYLRAHVETQIKGRLVRAMHESLDLDRFRNPVVKLMLPFRMPRRR